MIINILLPREYSNKTLLQQKAIIYDRIYTQKSFNYHL